MANAPIPIFRALVVSHYGAGHYGVVPWDASTGAVSSAAGYDNGRWSVADPRLPAGTDRVIARIRSLDGT